MVDVSDGAFLLRVGVGFRLLHDGILSLRRGHPEGPDQIGLGHHFLDILICYSAGDESDLIITVLCSVKSLTRRKSKCCRIISHTIKPVLNHKMSLDRHRRHHDILGYISLIRDRDGLCSVFQFHKALCDAAGFKGPLYECSIFKSKEAGKKLMEMLSKGASQPWQKTLEEMTGSPKMSAAAMLEYYEPLKAFLDEQNKGRTCGF